MDKIRKKWSIKILFDLYYQLRKAMIIDSESQEDLSSDTKMHKDLLNHLKNNDIDKAIKVLKEYMSLIKEVQYYYSYFSRRADRNFTKMRE